MKVALIHDHLAQDGGAEKVLRVLADMFPEAPIYTLLYEKKQTDKYLKNRQIETSVIQKLPGGVKHYQWYLPFMPLAVEFFDLRSYDLVISDTSSFAKGVITTPDTLHISYCHTPTRYLWSDTHQYINELKYNKWLKKIISMVLNRIRIWDRVAADRVDLFIANSKTVQDRITKYYRRQSTVIYPPVEVEKFKISDLSAQLPEEKYFLIGCRLAPYKRVDLVIKAFKILGAPYCLKIFGDGVDLPRLKKLAAEDLSDKISGISDGGIDGATDGHTSEAMGGLASGARIEFLGRVSEEDKVKLYSQAQAFINPQEEDFGITVVESMASGRPVIAYRKGGATETIIEGKTGIFFNEPTVESLVAAIKDFNPADFDSNLIREHAQQFSTANFQNKMSGFINQHLKNS